MALSPDNSWEKHLPDLLSYKKYTELDNVDISEYSNDYCKEKLGSADEVDKTFCNKIAKNLSILKDENVMQKRTYDCYYFNHWLYDNIGKKYYDGKTKGKKVNVSEKLLDFVSSAISQHIQISSCKGNAFGNPEGWKEDKDLHDYFENYEDIKCNDSDKSKCEKYVNYVTYIKTLYDTKVENCCEDDELYEYGYCEPYFKCENKYNPQNLLTQLKKELQLLDKKPEAPRNEGTGAVEPGKAPGSGGEEREKKTQEDEVATGKTGQEPKEKVVSGEVPTEKSADSPAQSAPEKNLPAKPEVTEPAGDKPGGLESRVEQPASEKTVGEEAPAEKAIAPESGRPKPVAANPVAEKLAEANPATAESQVAKPVAAKPVAVKTEETVSEEESAEREEAEEEANEEESSEGLTVEEVTAEDLVTEMTSTMQHEEALGPQPIESAEQGVPAISSHNREPASNAVPLRIADSPNTLGTAYEGLDSNFFRNVIMAIAVLGTIFFLFYYNRSSRLESSYRKKKKKKGKIFEHNYYEEYEKELAMYGSEETFLDSETDRLYLNYHPDQDPYY
ncbi:hypothetical protein PVBG_06183 [Plasmodium vivax Brazil I]|uniref:Variable surface protein Vir12-like protein n=1 Tax=Plasmodium vivax (strain Brazil I) TaxID=1033975 RepID=A0A0J9VN18_PLAV1|nr:hypothetical protein PVBG_06183 [Plasmodium vivax Brazil I]